MKTAYHFFNLVDWRLALAVIESSPADSAQKYYCDSVTLWSLARLFGRNLFLFSGVDCLRELVPVNQAVGRKPVKVLASGNRTVQVDGDVVILPFFEFRSDIEEYCSGASFDSNPLILGIASPKQNQLAQELIRLAELPVNCSIYCLGAAVYLRPDSSKFHWLSFFRQDPERGMRKIYATLRGFLDALIYPRQFKRFLSQLER